MVDRRRVEGAAEDRDAHLLRWGGRAAIMNDGERSQIRWMTAGGTSLATYLPLQAHFGFGQLPEDATVNAQVTWRDGTTTEYPSLELNQRLTLRKDGTYD